MVIAIHQSTVRNRLLAFMSADDFSLISPHLEFLALPRKFTLSEPNKIAGYSYFPEAGLGSIVATSAEGQQAEVGLFGFDGMTPTALVLEAETCPHAIFMQVAGDGYRVKSSALAEVVDASPSIRKLLSRYTQTMATQTAFTALSNAVHHVDERLARWILMCHDRTEGDEIALTHDFLSIMLAVRRPSVTTALHALEGNRLILAERGLITIRDREGLESFARDAYGQPEKEYLRLVGPLN
jgi:CRP-like cAMP-binding protein